MLRLGMTVVMLVTLCASGAWSAEGKGNGKGIEKREARVAQHIKHLQARLAKHPNAPENVKAAINKLIDDLGTKKSDLEKLAADRAAKDKAAVKADREQLKKDHELCHSDREALKALHPGKGKHKGKKEEV